jgi:hypothetical protein
MQNVCISMKISWENEKREKRVDEKGEGEGEG